MVSDFNFIEDSIWKQDTLKDQFKEERKKHLEALKFNHWEVKKGNSNFFDLLKHGKKIGWLHDFAEQKIVL